MNWTELNLTQKMFIATKLKTQMYGHFRIIYNHEKTLNNNWYEKLI